MINIHTIFEVLHTVPLFLIALYIAFNYFIMGIGLSGIKDRTVSIIAGLSSIGIFAGTQLHHAIEHMFDPCLGYTAALLYVAFAVSVRARKAISNS